MSLSLNHKNAKKCVEKRSNGKVFVHRNSYLIDLFENVHIRTVYHIFVAIFLGMFINTAAYDYLKHGKVTLGTRLITLAFAKFHLATLAWLTNFSMSCFTFFCFQIWAKNRNILPKLKFQRTWDYFWLLLLVIYYYFSFRLSGSFVITFNIPPGSAAIVMCEQTRMLMKVHSYIRSNSPKVLNYKLHTESELVLPTFKYFLFFMFVPTLIYKDSYPRTKKIDWNFVFYRCIEVIGEIFFLSFVVERLLNPTVNEIGLRKFTLNEIILCIFEKTIAGGLMLLLTFFLILHSWQNLFAELTKFGDRLFYSDWWTCTDFSGYFRKWNIIVQDWLYAYVYKDLHDHFFRNNTFIPKMAVFTISAIVHEWILTYMAGMFFPLTLIEFLFFGSLLHLLTPPRRDIFNILFWYGISFGFGSLVTMYSFEFWIRINAPIANPTLKDFFIPRLFTCDCISWA